MTPLLDILFILLFMVIMRSAQYVNTRVQEAEQLSMEAQQQVMEAEKQMEEALEKASEAEQKASEAIQKASEAEAKQLEAQQRADSAQARLDEYGSLLKGSVSARIEIRQEDTQRVLTFRSGDNEGRWVITPEMTGCEQFLKDNIQNLLYAAGTEDPAPAFLIFRYDPNRIYNVEYNMIYNVLSQLQQSNENVYLQFREQTEP